jgi:hypothetical protein
MSYLVLNEKRCRRPFVMATFQDEVPCSVEASMSIVSVTFRPPETNDTWIAAPSIPLDWLVADAQPEDEQVVLLE